MKTLEDVCYLRTLSVGKDIYIQVRIYSRKLPKENYVTILRKFPMYKSTEVLITNYSYVKLLRILDRYTAVLRQPSNSKNADRYRADMRKGISIDSL
jgi:hypothetical protein